MYDEQRVKDEIEACKIQVKNQQEALEELEREQAQLANHLQDAERSPFEQQARTVADSLYETKKICKGLMKEVVRLDESMKRRRKEMNVLWKQIQSHAHRGAEARSALRRQSNNHNHEDTTKEKQGQVKKRWQRRLSL